jgi:hypothetical protein
VLKIILPAAAAIVVLAAPVAATPIAPSAAGFAAQVPDNFEQVAQGNHRHRYRTPPRGWHRYGKRPHDWHRRGCAQIGPLWFCP